MIKATIGIGEPESWLEFDDDGATYLHTRTRIDIAVAELSSATDDDAAVGSEP